jgi:hypothetical protein
MANRPRALMTLGWFMHGSFALIAAFLTIVGVMVLLRDGNWMSAATFGGAAAVLYLLGLGMRRLLAGY